MKQEETTQHVSECNAMIEALRKYKKIFTEEKAKLQSVATLSVPKEKLTEIEHFQNQFHIQLINIHDVKEDLKKYQQISSFETSDDVLQVEYAKCKSEFVELEKAIKTVNSEFEVFVKGL